MGDWLTKDREGRRHVDLHKLPRRISLFIAIVVTLVVVIIARCSNPDPTVPNWIQHAIRFGGWAVLVILTLLVGRWCLMRRRRK